MGQWSGPFLWTQKTLVVQREGSKTKTVITLGTSHSHGWKCVCQKTAIMSPNKHSRNSDQPKSKNHNIIASLNSIDCYNLSCMYMWNQICVCACLVYNVRIASSLQVIPPFCLGHAWLFVICLFCPKNLASFWRKASFITKWCTQSYTSDRRLMLDRKGCG